MTAGSKVVYVAGKITGNPRYREQFANAQMVLEHMGYVVLNPATLPSGMEYEQYMNIDTAMLMEADTVCFLPNWKDSPGARKEKMLADKNKKRVLYYDRIRIQEKYI